MDCVDEFSFFSSPLINSFLSRFIMDVHVQGLFNEFSLLVEFTERSAHGGTSGVRLHL